MKLALLIGSSIAAVSMAGCSTPSAPRPDVEPPSRWRAAADEAASLVDRPWSELFKSPQLDALVREALTNNADLRIAAERVELARAQYGFQRSALFPTVVGDFGYARGRQPSGGESNVTVEASSLGLSVPTWELDLWGRVRSATEAARRQILASEETRRALYISLVGEVARSYLTLVDLDTQLEVSRQTVVTRGESLRVVKARFEGGITSASDLRQAESNLAGAEATIAAIERGRAQAENALSVLVGRNPGPILRGGGMLTVSTPARLPAGIPSDLLERRPDILAAEQQLQSASASVDAARKAYFPTISLTGFLGFASPALKELFEDGRSAWSVGPAVTLPLFTAGRLAANVDAAEAQQRIAVEQYRNTVQNAFREVEDALVAYERYQEQRAALERMVTANRERARLAELRYRNGVTIYVEVLLAQQQVFETELQFSQASRSVHESIVNLYTALGGGWHEAELLPAR